MSQVNVMQRLTSTVVALWLYPTHGFDQVALPMDTPAKLTIILGIFARVSHSETRCECIGTTCRPIKGVDDKFKVLRKFM